MVGERSAGAFAPRKFGLRFHRWLRCRSASVPVLVSCVGHVQEYTLGAVLRRRCVCESSWPDYDILLGFRSPRDRCPAPRRG